MTSLLHLFTLFPFFLIFTFIDAQPNNSTEYPSCPSYNCGNITIGYPFWRIGDQTATQYCGYRDFGIDCATVDGREIPSIKLGSNPYYVRNITYDTRAIVLANYDVSPAVNVPSCPRVQHGIDLTTLPFNFPASNVNLSFHFNCTGSPNPSFATAIPCLNFRDRRSYIRVISSETDDSDWRPYGCESEVVTTVFQYILDSIGDISRNFSRALRDGFELGWRKSDDDCEKCDDSDGRCGYNTDTNEFMCFCSGGTSTTDHCKVSNFNWKLALLISVLSAMLIILATVAFYFWRRRRNMKKRYYASAYMTRNISSYASNCIASLKRGTKDDRNVETFISQYDSLATKRYKYVDIQKMTNSFQVKLGQGGFGGVFKGKLLDGRVVAVKVLNPSKASGQEFINEVASIGRTSHINIVALLGFCSENQKRALIYEFMPNGSLEKYIYDQNPDKPNVQIIGVMKLYEIALGIARGLDYLHRGCNTRILHLDIKPHNILLDEDFCPKIADFGLAKLYSKKESIVSMLEARGTIGYIAPEVFSRNFGGVSHKSDVYSYGMLILEMVGGRKNVDGGVGSGHTSEIYFPYWVYDRLGKDEFLFDGVTNIEENEYARKMTIVGLWCIQTDPRQRPSINGVIEMLEGSMQALEVPPKPFFSSPPRTPATMPSSSENGQEVILIDEPHK